MNASVERAGINLQILPQPELGDLLAGLRLVKLVCTSTLFFYWSWETAGLCRTLTAGNALCFQPGLFKVFLTVAEMYHWLIGDYGSILLPHIQEVLTVTLQWETITAFWDKMFVYMHGNMIFTLNKRLIYTIQLKSTIGSIRFGQILKLLRTMHDIVISV